MSDLIRAQEKGKWVVVAGYILIALVLILGVGARVYDFGGSNPPGLNADEASSGYDSYCIGKYGIGRNGVKFPVHLIAWGSGQNALYAYFSLPFIKLLGLSSLSIRLPNLIFGILTLVFFLLTIKRLFNLRLALLSTLILAVSPWGIMISRWGLPENVMPAILMIGIYFYAKALDRRNYLILSFAFFALSFYAYGTVYFVLPLLMCGMVLLSFFHSKNRPALLRTVIISTIVFTVIGIPIFLFILINIFNLAPSGISLPFMSIPKLVATGGRYAQVVFLNPNLHSFGELWAKLLQNFGYFYDTVFLQRGAVWNVINNQVHKFGTLYLLSSYLFAVGFIYALVDWFRPKTRKSVRYIMIFILWFVLGAVLGIISETNTNRSNIIFLPMIFFVAYGIDRLAREIGVFVSHLTSEGQNKKLLQSVQLTMVIAGAVLYLGFYVSFAVYFYPRQYYPDHIGSYFNEGLTEAIAYTEKINTSGKKVYVSDKGSAYIYVLFQTRYNPYDFLKTVVYDNPNAAFRNVLSFDKYTFIHIDHQPVIEPNTYFILFNPRRASVDPALVKSQKEFRWYTVYEF